jgi:hypothetical protein
MLLRHVPLRLIVLMVLLLSRSLPLLLSRSGPLFLLSHVPLLLMLLHVHLLTRRLATAAAAAATLLLLLLPLLIVMLLIPWPLLNLPPFLYQLTASQPVHARAISLPD